MEKEIEELTEEAVTEEAEKPAAAAGETEEKPAAAETEEKPAEAAGSGGKHGKTGGRSSSRAGGSPEAWDKMEQCLEDKSTLDVKIDSAVKGGVIAYADGIRGFIPASKISTGYVENLEDWVGKEIQVQVITVEREAGRLVLSGRDLAFAKRREERKKRTDSYKPGSVVEGTVETIQDYGAFVKLDSGATGLLHVSQISDNRIKTPADVLKEGDHITVKVTAVKDGRISLSMKALNNADDAEIAERHVEYKEEGRASTNLGSLLKDIKLD